MQYQLQALESENLTRVEKQVEKNSLQIDEIVNGIVAPYCKELDRYVSFIRDCLKDGENPPTNNELEDFCMNLSTQIYFASGICENLGIRDDIAKAVYKEVYNSSRNGLDKGTVADKDSIATLQSQEEFIISSAYTRAYRIMRSKIEAAQEILSSCKKVLSHRIQEESLSQIGVR